MLGTGHKKLYWDNLTRKVAFAFIFQQILIVNRKKSKNLRENSFLIYFKTRPQIVLKCRLQVVNPLWFDILKNKYHASVNLDFQKQKTTPNLLKSIYRLYGNFTNVCTMLNHTAMNVEIDFIYVVFLSSVRSRVEGEFLIQSFFHVGSYKNEVKGRRLGQFIVQRRARITKKLNTF